MNLLAAIHQAASSRLAGYPGEVLLQHPAEVRRRSGDTRSVEGLHAALAALAAHREGDWHQFYEAGYCLLQFQDQADRRRERPCGGDALTSLIGALHEEGFTGPEILAAIFDQARSHVGILEDFDGQLVSYEPAPGQALKDISIAALRRRIQRATATGRCRRPG